MTTRLATLLADRRARAAAARRPRGHRGGLGAQLGSARSDALPRGRTTCCSPPAPSSLPTRRRARTTTTWGDSSTVGVAALGFGTEVVRVTPEPLVAACVAQDLPLLEVPYRTPFLALARRIADARAEQDHARDLWALDAQRALSLAALSRRADRRRAGGAESTAWRRRAAARCPRRAVVRARPTPPGPTPRPRPCRPRRGGCCTAGCGPDRPSTCRAGPVSRRSVTMQTLGRRDELRGVLAVAPPERPDASATAVITSAVALAEFAVEDAARREESTLALERPALPARAGRPRRRRPGRAGGRRSPAARGAPAAAADPAPG